MSMDSKKTETGPPQPRGGLTAPMILAIVAGVLVIVFMIASMAAYLLLPMLMDELDPKRGDARIECVEQLA